MRKISLLSALLMLFGLTATAQEYISVGEVLVPEGRQSMLEVRFHFDKGHDYVSYQFKVKLPEGISLVTDDDGYVPVVLGDGQPSARWSKDMPASSSIMKAYSSPSTVITADDGVLVCIPIQADGDKVSAGDELEGSLVDVEFTHNEGAVRNPFSDVTFTIKVTDKIILDENYTWTPYATSNACDLLVKRTIKAGEWSTVCFPFAMSADKLKAAFGDDYVLEEFTGYDVEEDADDKVTGLTLKFTKNTKAAKINTPYIIKVSHDVSEFEVNAVVNPGNAQKSIVVEDDDTGEEVEVASMTGTYVAGTVVPENSLFLSENKFYYSSGKTKMKGFRAYFTLKDVLADVSQSGARIFLSVGDETTEIHPVQMGTDDDGWYTLSGLKLDKKPAATGVYIHRGEKVVINEERMRK